MTWVDDAMMAAEQHLQDVQEAAEREAEGTVAHLRRMCKQLGISPVADEQVTVTRQRVLLELPTPGLTDRWRLVADVGRGKPEVRAEVQAERGSVQWTDRGPVETLTDLGLALDPGWEPDPEDDAPEPSTGDMLLTVLEAIVRDAVYDVVDGRLGDGTT